MPKLKHLMQNTVIKCRPWGSGRVQEFKTREKCFQMHRYKQAAARHNIFLCSPSFNKLLERAKFGAKLLSGSYNVQAVGHMFAHPSIRLSIGA